MKYVWQVITWLLALPSCALALITIFTFPFYALWQGTNYLYSGEFKVFTLVTIYPNIRHEVMSKEMIGWNKICAYLIDNNVYLSSMVMLLILSMSCCLAGKIYGLYEKESLSKKQKLKLLKSAMERSQAMK